MGPTRPVHTLPSDASPPPRMAESAQRHAATGLSLPNQPLGMNIAVTSPQAMKAAMFGMIMPERKVPNLCTATRVPPARGVAVVVDVVVMVVPPGSDAGLPSGGDGVGGRPGRLSGIGGLIGRQGCLGDRGRVVEGVPREGYADVCEGG